MNKRFIHFNLILIFFFCLFTYTPPLITVFSPIELESKLEKRKLSPLPELNLNFKGLSEFPEKFELFFNDHFGFRQILIFFNNFVKVKYFNKSPVDKVVIGKDGWLYYNLPHLKMIESFRGLVSLSPLQLESMKIQLEQNRDWLSQYGIPYLFVIAPNKVSIYPEFMPDRLNQIKNISMLDQFIEYMNTNSDVHILDLRTPLREAKTKGIVYYHKDSHWNRDGSFVVYKSVMEKALSLIPDKDLRGDIITQTGNETSGFADLAQLVGVPNVYEYSEEVQSPVIQNKCSRVLNDIKLPQIGLFKNQMPFVMGCKQANLHAVVFRDSFFIEVIPYLSENFKQVIYIWNFFDREAMEQVLKIMKPDIVIEESVERVLFSDVLSTHSRHKFNGIDLLNKGDIEKAIVEFRKALHLRPDSPDSYNNLGTALLKGHQFDEAIIQFRKALEISPGHYKVKKNLSLAMNIRKAIVGEISAIQNKLLLHPENFSLLNKLGRLYLKKREPDKAIKSFLKASSIRPESPEVLTNLAISYDAKKQYKKAVSYFKKIIFLQPENPDNYYNLSCVYAKLNNKKKSILWLKKALQKGYDNWELINSDNDLENIRNAASFKRLLKAHDR